MQAPILNNDTPITRREAQATGHRFYFTGRPCENDHYAWREVASRGCTACRPEFGINFLVDISDLPPKLAYRVGLRKRHRSSREQSDYEQMSASARESMAVRLARTTSETIKLAVRIILTTAPAQRTKSELDTLTKIKSAHDAASEVIRMAGLEEKGDAVQDKLRDVILKGILDDLDDLAKPKVPARVLVDGNGQTTVLDDTPVAKREPLPPTTDNLLAHGFTMVDLPEID